MRAGAAKGGLYGNDSAEAMYPYTRTDAKGETLDGSKHNYTLTFPADQLPPVNAFWSLTMYDGKNQLLIKNPVDRYLLNSPMLPAMQKNPDGRAVHSKGQPRQSPGSQLATRTERYDLSRHAFYWPKDTQPSILPGRRGTWQPPGIVVTQ